MALNIQNNNYAGMLAKGISSLITVGSRDMGLFHVKPTNGSKARFAYTSTDVVVQELDGLCSFQDLGGRDLDFINLVLSELGSQQAVCKSELFSTDYALGLGGYLNQQVEPELLNEWAMQTVDGFSSKIEELRWSGDANLTGTTGIFDGIIVQIKDVGAYSTGNTCGYQQVASTAITSSNAIDRIKAVILALPEEVRGHKDFKVILAPAVASALESQIMTTALSMHSLPLPTRGTGDGLFMANFYGYRLYVVNGLKSAQVPANNNIVLAGIFADTKEGVLKLGVLKPSDERDILIMDIGDYKDSVGMRIGTALAVGVIPCLSQVAMNA
jgi:hypothetical protein